MPSSNVICQTVLDCNKVLNIALIELDRKTSQVQQLEKDKQEIIKEREILRSDRETWRNLYLDERKASNSLAASNLSQQTAINEFQTQRKLDENLIVAQKRKIRWLRVEKYVYSGLSFGAGFGAGYAIGSNKNTITNFLESNRNSGFKVNF